MSFGTAISTCFKKYAVFAGRAQRSEFWYWVLFVVILSIIANILDSVFGTRISMTNTGNATYVSYYQTGWITTIVDLVLILPGISVAVRRLHDTGRSGWWWWLNAICCIGSIILLFLYIGDSTVDNKYGPNPKGGTAPSAT